jgi:hypothetical protein
LTAPRTACRAPFRAAARARASPSARALQSPPRHPLGGIDMLIDRNAMQLDTGAWRFQVWVAFALSLATTTWGIWFVPADPWVKGFLMLGLYFTVSSAFTLAKTVRDEHESKKILNRIGEAKAVQMLREYGEEA